MRGWLKKAVGDRGERAAARFLRRQGFKIVARQYTNRLGEIDLIARDGGQLVFVEVKTRQSESAGHPVEAVTRSKQEKLTRVALAYLKRNGLLETPARFDVVAVAWNEGEKRPRIDHYRNAFAPTGFGQMYS